MAFIWTILWIYIHFVEGQCDCTIWSKIVHLMLRKIDRYEQEWLISWHFHDPPPMTPWSTPNVGSLVDLLFVIVEDMSSTLPISLNRGFLTSWISIYIEGSQTTLSIDATISIILLYKGTRLNSSNSVPALIAF